MAPRATFRKNATKKKVEEPKDRNDRITIVRKSSPRGSDQVGSGDDDRMEKKKEEEEEEEGGHVVDAHGGHREATLWWLLLFMGLDFVCVGLIVPLLSPFLREALRGSGSSTEGGQGEDGNTTGKEEEVSASALGFVSSVYGAVQIFSAPVLGRISDRLGERRPVLLISLVGGAIGYAMLALVPPSAMTLSIIVFSRVVSGVFRQSLTITKAWVSDLASSPAEIRANLSRIYAVVATGFIVGPALGGILADRLGYRAPFLLASGSFLCIASVGRVILPPGKVKKSKDKLAERGGEDEEGNGGNGRSAKDRGQELTTSSSSSSSASSAGFRLAALRPAVRRLLILRFIIGCSVLLSRQGIFMLLEFRPEIFPSFSTILNRDESSSLDTSSPSSSLLSSSPSSTRPLGLATKGAVLSFYSVASIISQLFLVAPISQHSNLSSRSLVIFSSVLLGVGQLTLVFSTGPLHFLLSLTVIAASSSVLKTTMGALLAAAAGPESYGEILGLAGSVFSVCRAVAPLVAGILVDQGGPATPGVVASTTIFFAAMVATVGRMVQEGEGGERERERIRQGKRERQREGGTRRRKGTKEG